MLARTLIFRVVRRSDRSGRRRSPRERETGSFELCLPYRFSPGGGDWRSAWHRSLPIPTRFLTADDVPESKEESHEVAGKGKSLRLRNRPRSHEGSGGRRTNVVEVRTRKITFPFSLRGLLSNRDWKEIQCRLPPAACRRDGRLSLSPPVSAAQLRATRRSSTACALCHRRDASVLLEMEDL